MASSLDLVHEYTGEAVGPELIEALARMPLARVDDLAAQLVADPPTPGGVPPNEVWPLVNLRSSTFGPGGTSGTYASSGSTGLRLADSIDPRQMGTGAFSNSVLRALLYCHGLVIEDPLLLGADLYSGTTGETRIVARQAVVAGAASLVEIAPLVGSGVVETFFTGTTARGEAGDIARKIRASVDTANSPLDDAAIWEAFESDYVDGLHPELRALWNLVREGDRNPDLEHIQLAAEADREMTEIFIKVLSELRPRAVVDNAIDVVALALADAHELGDRHDLLCPSPLFARLLFAGSADPLNELRIHQLARLEVPNIEGLLMEDAVRIRSSSEAFAIWRTRLSTGLDRARQLKAEVGDEVDTVEVVAEILAEARQGMFKEVGRSVSLNRRMSGTAGFVAGTLGGALGGAAGGASGAILGAAGGTLPWLTTRAFPFGPPGYLRRHYVVFERLAPT